MIIGNGLLASSFNEIELEKNVLIFASGVSNSKEQDHSKYEKELNLLKTTIKKFPEKKIVYFSSCSVFSKKNTKYINHKKSIEKYFEDEIQNFLILRLPIVVGKTNNKNQLIKYFYNALIENIPIKINTNVYRYLIDAEDLMHILNIFKYDNKKIINIAHNNPINVIDIVRFLEKLKNKKFIKIENYEDNEDVYDIDNSYFLEKSKGLNLFNIHPHDIISKYYEN